MEARLPVILGWDLVSPLGTDPDDQWTRALAGESGVGPLTRFNPPEGFPVTIAGQVPEMEVSDYPFLSPRQLALWPSPIFKHSLLVVYRALKHAGIEITEEIASEIGVTFSAAVGGLDAVLSADRALMNEGRLPKPCVNPNSCINMVTGKVSILTGATGPNLSTVTACATGNTSLVVGALMIASGMAKAFICGGVDFPLVEPIVAGFATMNGAYKTGESEPPEKASRPFSKNRRGFVISEGAACLILADPEFARAHGLAPIAELAGWFMNSDAGHFVAPSLPTVTRCMAGAIEHAGIEPADIDAVNAHAASTKIGDKVEAVALKTVFGRDAPPVCANKSQIGHSMGAAAAIELIWAIKGLREGVIPPTINLDSDPDLGLECLSNRMLRIDQEFVLKNSFGFGGTNCCTVFRRL